MGLSEAKRKNRLVGSAITNNSAWTNDASLPGQRLLSSMGWSQGQGLGTSSQGTAVPIIMAFKMDNKGIGARRFEKEARESGKADAWVGGAGQLGDLFERLNKASGSTLVSSERVGTKEEEQGEESGKVKKSKKSYSEKVDSSEKRQKKDRKGKGKEEQADEIKVEEAVQKVASTLPNRMASRARFLRAKRMVGTDMASVNEILGIASPAGPSSPTPLEQPATDSKEGTSSDSPPLDQKQRKRKREVSDVSTKTDDKKAKKEAKEAKRLAKELRREEKAKKKKQQQNSEELPKDPASDPSFAAGGGMKVSTLSVQEYLQNKLTKRRAAIVRRRREEEESLWTRAATICA